MEALNPAESIKSEIKGSWNIPAEEFKKIVDLGEILVVDVREINEVEVVRVDAKNYVNISVKKLDEALKMDKDAFESTYNCPKPRPDEELALICRSGRRSLAAIEIARANNYVHVRHFDEGTNGWVERYPNQVVSSKE